MLTSPILWMSLSRRLVDLPVWHLPTNFTPLWYYFLWNMSDWCSWRPDRRSNSNQGVGEMLGVSERVSAERRWIQPPCSHLKLGTLQQDEVRVWSKQNRQNDFQLLSCHCLLRWHLHCVQLHLSCTSGWLKQTDRCKHRQLYVTPVCSLFFLTPSVPCEVKTDCGEPTASDLTRCWFDFLCLLPQVDDDRAD